MDDIAVSDAIFVFVPKSQQGGRGITAAGFNFYRIYLVFSFAVIRDDEVNLNVITPFFLAVVSIKKQSMTIGNKHLCNGIFINHSCVKSQLSGQNLLIYLVRKQLVFIKCMTDQKTRITHVALDVGIGLGE